MFGLEQCVQLQLIGMQVRRTAGPVVFSSGNDEGSHPESGPYCFWAWTADILQLPSIWHVVDVRAIILWVFKVALVLPLLTLRIRSSVRTCSG